MTPTAVTAVDVANGVFVVVALMLMVAAAISLIRAADRLSGTRALLWFLLVVVVPVVGPVLWLAVGRRRARPAEPPA